jgi:hypothetical protein
VSHVRLEVTDQGLAHTTARRRLIVPPRLRSEHGIETFPGALVGLTIVLGGVSEGTMPAFVIAGLALLCVGQLIVASRR